MYYHASQTKGIEVLEPRISNHGVPLIYFSKKAGERSGLPQQRRREILQGNWLRIFREVDEVGPIRLHEGRNSED